MSKWTLFYENGSWFSDTDGEPHESPPWGVVAVRQDGVDPPVMVNSDWLMWRTDLGEWTECGRDGFDDHACHYGHLIGCWRKTRWVRKPDFMAIWKRARGE
jgi:hypothetical protein